MDKVLNRPKVAVIGSGFAGLSAACYLAKNGADVTIYEKNQQVGGRARQLVTENGYSFDMGPSWYWMPGVFEQFFADFGYVPSDFYQLSQLDPGFSIVFGKDDMMHIPKSMEKLEEIFEQIEKGSAIKLRKFLSGAAFKYKVGMENLVHKPGLSFTEFLDMDVMKGALKLQLLQSFRKHVKKYFNHPKLIALMEFPILFLGATAKDTPALYSLMNYAGLSLGTWYPKGGMVAVIDGMRKLAEQLGVKILNDEPVEGFIVNQRKIKGVKSKRSIMNYDGIVAAADYHHVEDKLLGEEFRNYSEQYWDKRMLAPSSLIFYLGVNKKIEHLSHHTLFFDEDLEVHATEIYEDPKWPSKPLFYVCCPSKSDETVAPLGHENIFVLMPLATGLEDTEELRESYFKLIMKRLERFCGQDITNHLDYKRSYCIKDFVNDYHSYKGNAYGLANTLMQTANLKPSIKNKKLDNLFYAGQLTVPGPGVPPSIISGKLAATELYKNLGKR
ncbi:phytoene desaturase family protein [Pedobacter boryungensis]|uniref:Phytoene desaturase n=1 Tax=Pedobacter boryungensis TaxID=869962 RepID=A0ABX2DBS3_9SPHI|nr:phytoene desaturase family protein [Pedobacter boryungensis]NQX30619.1 phytoene desaturase [Pedobacter boryungensis]